MLKPMRHLASLSAMAARACVEAGLWELPPDSEDEEAELSEDVKDKVIKFEPRTLQQ